MRSIRWLLILTLSTAASVDCRDRLRLADRDRSVSDEDLLQQSEATTTLSLTHSVRIYQQSDSATPRLPTRVGRLARRRPSPQEASLEDDDFNWETYLALNPDLSRRQYGSQEKALQHYRDTGHTEQRLKRLPQVILRYTAATGLSNQHYCHIAAFSLCAALGRCSLVLPPAVARSSFQDAFSVFKEFNKVQWSAMPLETLYDTDKIAAEWGKSEIAVYKTPALQKLPSLVEPETAFPGYVDKFDARLSANLSDIYLRAYDLSELQEMASKAVAQTARQYMQSTGAAEAPYVVLDLPVTLFMMKTNNHLGLVSQVAKKLYFAPVVHRLAKKVLDGMSRQSSTFYGAHLRVEADAMDWARSMGGFEAYWGQFLQAMRTAGFQRDAPVYVATGLLSYAAGHATLAKLTANLTAEGLCSQVTYKEQFLSSAELESLHSEQKALVDLIVLANAQCFVGFEPSTFSFFLTQYRVLQGLSPSSSVLVEGKIIGTNPLFEAAAVIVENGFQKQKLHEVNGIATNRRLTL